MKSIKSLFKMVSGQARSTKKYVERRRRELSLELNDIFQARVAYGLFRGMKLSQSASWSVYDRAPMLLGIYEEEVLEIILKLPAHIDVFINIGAADGYYAIGALTSGRFRKSIAYEMEETSRRAMADNALLNNVVPHISIRETADTQTLSLISDDLRGNSFVLIDIEGYEFTLLNDKNLTLLKDTFVVVEIHIFDAESVDQYQLLLERCKNTHKTRVVMTGARDLSRYPEISHFSDNDRWLLCSEGRPYNMSWLVLEPL